MEALKGFAGKVCFQRSTLGGLLSGSAFGVYFREFTLRGYFEDYFEVYFEKFALEGLLSGFAFGVYFQRFTLRGLLCRVYFERSTLESLFGKFKSLIWKI